jgi:protein gp37
MNKTKIDWCDRSWNPVTGCLHGCDYCYARNIANRFYSAEHERFLDMADGLSKELESPIREWKTNRILPYPFCFEPTFHKYRLDEPQKIKQPQNIFVCSMADLFGDWVPEEWIQEVFEACDKAPWHNYLFLTKNPKRYRELTRLGGYNCWLGATIGQNEEKDRETIKEMAHLSYNFLSAEPLHYDISNIIDYDNIDWLIVGEETGNRKGKIEPLDSWIRFLRDACRYYNMPLFIKEPLCKKLPVMIQEQPHELSLRNRR